MTSGERKAVRLRRYLSQELDHDIGSVWRKIRVLVEEESSQHGRKYTRLYMVTFKCEILFGVTALLTNTRSVSMSSLQSLILSSSTSLSVLAIAAHPAGPEAT